MDGNVPLPIPYKLRPEVKDEDIKALMQRDFVTGAQTDAEKLEAVCRWALSYQEAYEQQKAIMDHIHGEATKYIKALNHVHKEMDDIRTNAGNSLRLLGSSCHIIKVLLLA